MNLYEIKAKIEAERKAREATESVVIVDAPDGVKPESELKGLELPDFNGVPNDVLFTIADISYRIAGIRTSRLVQSDPQKEIGGLVAYLLDEGQGVKNVKQRRQWLVTYVTAINRLVSDVSAIQQVVDSVVDLRVESAEEVAYRLLKQARGNVAIAWEASKAEGREIPKWVFNKALEKLTAEIFAKMA